MLFFPFWFARCDFEQETHPFQHNGFEQHIWWWELFSEWHEKQQCDFLSFLSHSVTNW